MKFGNLTFVARYAVVSSVVLLSACGGRVAQTVAETRDFDDRLSCVHLSGEFARHEARLTELLGERKQSNLENIYWLTNPLFLDLSNTQREEAEAIALRQDRLVTLMEVRECPDIPVLDSPETDENESNGTETAD